MKITTRELDLNGIKLGAENPPVVACEILTHIPHNHPELLKQSWGSEIYNPIECVKKAEGNGVSVLAIRFNIENCEDIAYEIGKSKELLTEILATTNLPLILTGTFRRDVDVKLLTELAKTANKKCTIGAVEEENYKEIAPIINEYGHNIIARTPIDINLTKQLNILLTEQGFSPDRIIIDPNTSAVGYGLDYAYSIIERIKLAGAAGDSMLNMPIITFVGEEAWKTKEAKSDQVAPEWGDFLTRAISWESITASSMLVSGADVVVLRHLDSIKYINKFIAEEK